MTIQSFDKASVTAFQKEVDVAMKALAAKHGVDLVKNSGRFSPDKFGLSIEFKARTVTASGAVVSASLATGCRIYGIDSTKAFKDHTGRTHKLVDYNSRAKKTPFITKCTDGRQYRWTAEAVKRLQAL